MSKQAVSNFSAFRANASKRNKKKFLNLLLFRFSSRGSSSSYFFLCSRLYDHSKRTEEAISNTLKEKELDVMHGGVDLSPVHCQHPPVLLLPL